MKFHPEIRSVEACFESSSLAVKLAKESGAHLHIAHVTTARELEFFGKDENITGEAVIAHLYFSDEDYADKKAFIKCNPAIKTVKDRQALREALADGRISVVGTDHAPHEWKDKQGGCAKAASGMPMVQFSLVSMLELVDEGVLSIERMVEVMSHCPAKLFQVDKRGFCAQAIRPILLLFALILLGLFRKKSSKVNAGGVLWRDMNTNGKWSKRSVMDTLYIIRESLTRLIVVKNLLLENHKF